MAGALRVTGLLVLGLAAVAVWCALRWPVVAVMVVLVWVWRRRRRARLRSTLGLGDPFKAERERLGLELLRARVAATWAKVDPDAAAAERDFREGKISRHDLDTALAMVAERARSARGGGRFKVHG